MTTLMQRSDMLAEKIKSLIEARVVASDLTHIQQRTEEWNKHHSALMNLCAQTALLKLDRQDEALVATKKDAFRLNAQKVLSRLLENRDIKELTRDAAWTRLLGSCEGLTKELDVAGRKAWQAYLEQLGTLESPATLRSRTPQTPSNDVALGAYQVSYASFAAIAHLKLPRSADDLKQISAYATSCREALSSIAFNLPNEVKAFYEAISAGTATLAHVTPTVANWLREQGYLDRFRVRNNA